MSEKDTPEMDECLHVSYHIPKWMENGKIHWDDVQLQHKSLNAEAKCIVPPTKAIPVIFIPGIMGTNLKDSEGKKVWRADLLMGMTYLRMVSRLKSGLCQDFKRLVRKMKWNDSLIIIFG